MPRRRHPYVGVSRFQEEMSPFERDMARLRRLFPGAQNPVQAQLEQLMRSGAKVPLRLVIVPDPNLRPQARGAYYLPNTVVPPGEEAFPIGSIVLEVRDETLERWLRQYGRGRGLEILKSLLAHEVGHANTAGRLGPYAPQEQREKAASAEGHNLAEEWGVLPTYLEQEKMR